MSETVPEDAHRHSRESGNPVSATERAGLPSARIQSNTSEWRPICALDDIPQLGARVVSTRQGDIALFRDADDQVFAIDDRCPHKGGRLSQGIVFGRKVACPLHNWTICLNDGKAVAPDEGCVKTFGVKIEDGQVFLLL